MEQVQQIKKKLSWVVLFDHMLEMLKRIWFLIPTKFGFKINILIWLFLFLKREQ